VPSWSPRSTSVSPIVARTPTKSKSTTASATSRTRAWPRLATGRREVVMDARVRRDLEIGNDEIDIPEFLKED
jgi:hypothetical protein